MTMVDNCRLAKSIIWSQIKFWDEVKNLGYDDILKMFPSFHIRHIGQIDMIDILQVKTDFMGWPKQVY